MCCRIPKSRWVGITTSVLHITGLDSTTTVRLRTYCSSTLAGTAPALLWIHGGGYVIGRPEQDALTCVEFARELRIAVVAVAYRLARAHPFPAALDDCHAALRYIISHAAELGIALRVSPSEARVREAVSVCVNQVVA